MKIFGRLCFIGVIAVALVFWQNTGPLIVRLLLLALFFVPSITAFLLEKSSAGAIFGLNFWLGLTIPAWEVLYLVTVVGWLSLLAWALGGKTARARRQAALRIYRRVRRYDENTYTPLGLKRLSRGH